MKKKNGIQLSVENQKAEGNEEFNKLIKIGVYKELKRKGLISDIQLNELIIRQGMIHF